MKKLAAIALLIVLSTTTLKAQDRIMVKGKTILGRPSGSDAWVFQDSSDTLIAIKFSEYKELNKMIEELLLQEKRMEAIIKAKDELRETIENYEQKADNHIDVQTRLISTADSLYQGYKSLYTDLKKIFGVSKFSLIVGGGVGRVSGDDVRPFGNVGAEYQKFQGNLQFGSGYKGISLGYRIPIF